MLAVNVALPTSKVSRARTLFASPGVQLQLVKGFEHFIGGDLMIISSLIYAHPFYSSRNPEVVDPRAPGAFQCVGGNTCSDMLSGTLNPSDTLTTTLFIGASWGKVSPGISYLGGTQWVYHPAEVRANQIQPQLGDEIITSGQQNPQQVRATHLISAFIDYNLTSWITAEVGYNMSRNVLDADGRFGNPFYSRYQDTRVYLSTSIQLDNLVKILNGDDHGEAGIVRADNRGRHPFGTF